jgi:hypothetical protein
VSCERRPRLGGLIFPVGFGRRRVVTAAAASAVFHTFGYILKLRGLIGCSFACGESSQPGSAHRPGRALLTRTDLCGFQISKIFRFGPYHASRYSVTSLPLHITYGCSLAAVANDDYPGSLRKLIDCRDGNVFSFCPLSGRTRAGLQASITVVI